MEAIDSFRLNPVFNSVLETSNEANNALAIVPVSKVRDVIPPCEPPNDFCSGTLHSNCFGFDTLATKDEDVFIPSNMDSFLSMSFDPFLPIDEEYDEELEMLSRKYLGKGIR